VAEHRHRRLHALVVRREPPSENGAHSERRVVVAAREHDVGPLHRAVHLGRHAPVAEGHRAREEAPPGQLLEGWVGEAGVGEPHQAIGLVDSRQRSNHQRVDQAEDGRIRADSERQRGEGDGRDTGALRERAPGEAEVLPQLVEPARAPHVAAFFFLLLDPVHGAQGRGSGLVR